MSTYGPVKVFNTTIASGASTATFTLDKSYQRVFLEVSTMSTAAAFDVYASGDGTTYRQVFERVNTATCQYQSLTVATNVTNGVAPLDVSAVYLQFRASAVVSGGVTMALHCSD